MNAEQLALDLAAFTSFERAGGSRSVDWQGFHALTEKSAISTVPLSDTDQPED